MFTSYATISNLLLISLSSIATTQTVYDPSSDKFIALYNKDHQWKNGNRKLWKALRKFTYMLRRVFPDRFTPTQSELVIPIGSGDYPHVIPTKLPHTNGIAPVLMFGSAFRDPQMYSNMIAMPMPENHHLDCFLEWVEHDYSTVCDLLQSGALVFGEEEGLEYDTLIVSHVFVLCISCVSFVC